MLVILVASSGLAGPTGRCPSCIGLDEVLQVNRTQPGPVGQNTLP